MNDSIRTSEIARLHSTIARLEERIVRDNQFLQSIFGTECADCLVAHYSHFTGKWECSARPPKARHCMKRGEGRHEHCPLMKHWGELK